MSDKKPHPVNSEEWDRLVSAYYAGIYKFALRMTSNGAEAEDITQEVFFAAYRAGLSISPEPSLKAWLYKTARNRCIDRLRWWKRWSKLLQADRSGKGVQTSPAQTSSELEEMIHALPLRQREVFVLRHWHGFSTQETAEILGISSGAVKSHLLRAVNKLKAEIFKC